MTVRVLCGDALEVLRTLDSASVHCAVTSVPYHGLRKYIDDDAPEKPFEIGLEASPSEWVARLVEVFREVKRVLRHDGTLWINCGDSYTSSPPGNTTIGVSARSTLHGINNPSGSYRQRLAGGHATKRNTLVEGYKPKDLTGLPWMLAYALRDDSWWLRDAIVLAKEAPMPESVSGWRFERHRVKEAGEWVECLGCPKCEPNNGLVLRKGSWRHTSSYEMLFMFAKSETYFADGEALREPDLGTDHKHRNVVEPVDRSNGHLPADSGIRTVVGRNGTGRNPRNVWRLSPERLPTVVIDGEKIDHFAAFPREIPRRAILAATSAKGVCPACGNPWVRVVERGKPLEGNRERDRGGRTDGFTTFKGGQKEWDAYVAPTTVGWLPSCGCDAGEPEPSLVLDCFCGSGTTGIAAEELGRDVVLIDLSPQYVRLAQARLERARAARMIGEADRAPPLPGQLSLL